MQSACSLADVWEDVSRKSCQKFIIKTCLFTATMQIFALVVYKIKTIKKTY